MSWGGFMFIFIEMFLFLLGIGWKCLDMHRKLMFGHFQIGKCWEQFTNNFVFHCNILCTGPRSPNPLWWCGDLENIKFDAVLHISCNYHQTLIFSELAQCSSPWDGDCKTLNFCGVWPFHVILSKTFLVNGAQTLWRGGGTENINFTFHWIPIMFFMNWPLNHLPLFYTVVLPNVLCLILDISCKFLGKKRFFCKLAPPHHSHEEGVWWNMGFLYRSGYFIQFVAKNYPHLTPTFEG